MHDEFGSDLNRIADYAAGFASSLPARPVGSAVSSAELLRQLQQPCPIHGVAPRLAVEDLVRSVEPALVANASPRHFGFVMSAPTPGSVMADWLTSVWNQNAFVEASSPAAAAVESLVARWVLELLGLPADASVGLVTGGQMANFTALAVARQTVLERAGWDYDAKGLFGAPEPVVLISEAAHGTVRSALRMLGFGTGQIRPIPCDGEGRMQLDRLQAEIDRARTRPLIVSVQAGNVNTGAFEPIGVVAELTKGANAWIHVDGAFGLWAATSPRFKHLLQGHEHADSWATDAHKWLNVPFDSGLVIMKDAARHRKLKVERCAYAGAAAAAHRDGSTWVAENSRRARAFVLYVALREMGRDGICSLVERCCARARQFAEGVARIPGAEVLNDVVLSQVIFRIGVPAPWNADRFHSALAEAIQADGRCWMGVTRWHEQTVLRVSITNRLTTEDDVEIALRTVRDCAAKLAAAPSASH